MAMSAQIGAHIRRTRLDKGLKQAELAKASGISPSYLNLIEHGRRRIGGKLIADLAEALGVAPESLNAGMAAADVQRLKSVAAAHRGKIEVEAERADELALRFPGWADLVITQAKEAEDLARQMSVMSDRMRKDPVLAASLHNILSTVTAIRSTAGILAGDDPVEVNWQRRFHRNLYEESQRLADATEALVGDLEEGVAADLSDPVEMAERFLGDWSGLADLTAGPAAAEAMIEQARAAMGDRPAFDIVRDFVAEIAEDEARLPLDTVRAAIKTEGSDPFHLAEVLDVRFPIILRRLAVVPDLGAGFVRTDGEGGVRLRHVRPGFSVPRFGASRLLWPIYAALDNPGRAEAHGLGATGKSWDRHRAWAIAERQGPGGLRATMLILPEAP